MSTSPCQAAAVGAPEASWRAFPGNESAVYGGGQMGQHHAVAAAPRPQLFAVPPPLGVEAVSGGSSPWSNQLPGSPCRSRAGPFGMLSTSPGVGNSTPDASSRAPPPLTASFGGNVSSPCNAQQHAQNFQGITSTSPVAMQQGQCYTATGVMGQQAMASYHMGAEAYMYGQYGSASSVSPSPEGLQQWCVMEGQDLLSHLKANEPETYED